MSTRNNSQQQIDQFRSTLTSQSYEAYQKATPAEKYRILASQAPTPSVRQFFLEEARKQDEQDARTRAQWLEIHGTLEPEDVTRHAQHFLHAYQQGPLLSERIKWNIRKGSKAFANGLKKIYEWFTSPFRFIFKHSFALLTITVVAELAFTLYFNIRHELGFNAFIYSAIIILSIVMGFMGRISESENGRTNKPKIIWLTTALVGISLISLLSTWKCFAPEKGYIGVVMQNNQPVDVVDSSHWFIRPPNIFKNQDVIWYDLLADGPNRTIRQTNRDTLSMEAILREEWSKSFTLTDQPAIVTITAQKVPKLEAFKNLPGSGRNILFYKSDIRVRVQQIIEARINPNSTTSEDLGKLAQEINQTSNDLYQIHGTSISFTLQTR